jgi:prefoldin subunit 5|tara:strand:+ start:1295 stop:1612 length:318 start_codon:yes stop_codon:yes gene_type:complete
MKSLKEFNKTGNEFQLLDEQTQQELVEISVGKLSTTILIGRLKLLSNKIKDVSIRKSIMSLGYMIYTVSLQSKSIEGIEKKLDQLIKLTEQNEQELKRIKMRSRT